MPLAARVIERDSLLGMVGAPIVWAVHFVTVYVLVSLACAFRFAEGRVLGIGIVPFLIGIATLIAVILITMLARLGYRRWRQTEADRRRMDPDLWERRRFMALTALLLSGLSLIATIWVAVPVALIEPCR